MNHVELAAQETWNHNPNAVVCVCCETPGTGLIRDGWDLATDDEGAHHICAECSRDDDDE